MASTDLSMDTLQRLTEGIHGIDGMAQQQLAQALAGIDMGDRRAVAAVMRGFAESGATASSRLAAQFYRGMSLLQTGEDADVDGSFAYDQTAADIALAGMYNQADGDMDKLARLVGERISYEINRAAKVSVWRNGQRDSREVRYARVPTGPETCAWCLMTAGLGFWFMTAEAASHTHRGCDCQIIPAIGGIQEVHIRGYDSTVYRDMWRTANKLRANGDIPADLAERIDRQKAAKGSAYRLDTNGTLAVMRQLYNLK